MSTPAGVSDTLVCEYFAEVGVREQLASANVARGGGGAADALLRTVFEPKVLVRLPRENRPGEGRQFPELAMFVFPHGARLVTPEEAMANPIPVVTSFVLTAGDKSRMYGACIVWHEQLPEAVSLTFLEQLDLLPEGAKPPTVHAPEAICLLSRMPVFEGLMECCRQLFRMRLQVAPAHSAPPGTASLLPRLVSRDRAAPLVLTPFRSPHRRLREGFRRRRSSRC